MDSWLLYIFSGTFVLLTVVSIHLWLTGSRTSIAISDIGALLFVLLQGLETKRSSVCSTATEYASVVAVAINLYFLARCASKDSLLRAMMICVAVCLTLVTSCIDLFLELDRIRFFSAFGWTAMDSIRAYLPAIGSLSRNDSLTLLLALFAFACSSNALFPRSAHWRVGILLTEVCAVSTLLLAFSSGIYLGIAIFTLFAIVFAVLCLRQIRTMIVIQQIGVCVVALTVVLLFGQAKAVWRTAVPFGNAMHTRSASGRFIVWHHAVTFITEHAVLGVGGYCGPCALLAKDVVPHRPFTAHSYNGVLEVLEQNGVVGLASYALWLLGALWQGVSTVKDTTVSMPDRAIIAIVSSGAVSVLCVDMVYGAIPHAWGPMWVFACMLGLIASPVEGTPADHEVF